MASGEGRGSTRRTVGRRLLDSRFTIPVLEPAMQHRYVTVDVFADRPFAGNPLAVVLDAVGLSPAQMQAIAAEFNYAETTFVLPPREASHTAHVRIFSPRNELPFAGHPNVGTAFVLARARPGAGPAARFEFEEQAGIVPLELIRDGGEVVGAELTAPESLSVRSAIASERAAGCIGLDVSDLRTDHHPPTVVSVGLPFVVVEVRTRDALRRACPSVAAHGETLPCDGADAVYLYTRDVTGSAPGVDIEARMFAPLDGIVEDPATGSATAAMAAFLAHLTPDPDGEARLRFSQGVDFGRPSVLETRTRKRAGVVEAVRVGGRCVPIMEGRLEL
jgi:trans-2,3-dihydro-3-hydroxyanthranilate isomerase